MKNDEFYFLFPLYNLLHRMMFLHRWKRRTIQEYFKNFVMNGRISRFREILKFYNQQIAQICADGIKRIIICVICAIFDFISL